MGALDGYPLVDRAGRAAFRYYLASIAAGIITAGLVCFGLYHWLFVGRALPPGLVTLAAVTLTLWIVLSVASTMIDLQAAVLRRTVEATIRGYNG